jgi:hypothetical protein
MADDFDFGNATWDQSSYGGTPLEGLVDENTTWGDSAAPKSWWGQANDWATRQFGPDAGKKLQQGLSGLSNVVKLNTAPQQNPATAAASAILKGATPASVVRGQAPQMQQILAALAAREQALRGTGLTQSTVPRPAYGGGLLGM